MNIAYHLSTRHVAGMAEVLVRVYHGKHINQQTPTGIFAPVSAWNTATGSCTISKRYETPSNTAARKAQSAIDSLSQYIYTQFTADKEHISSGWLKSVVHEYNHPRPSEPPLHEVVEDYINVRQVSPATACRLRTFAGLLRAFAAERGELYKSTLTKADIEDFALFLREYRVKRSPNSIACRLRELRSILYFRGKPHPNPFDEYTIPTESYGTPIYLTREERDYLYIYPDLSPKKAIQRDIFIFQCHVGCRISDLYRLTWANIKDGWLVYSPIKTARENPVTLEVPLSNTALEILNRYKGIDMRGRLLPFISKQKYNDAIVDILHQADISRPVVIRDPLTQQPQTLPLYQVASSHTARKTFIQILYAQTGNKRFIASMTGHSENSTAFNRYSEVSRDMKAATIAACDFPATNGDEE